MIAIIREIISKKKIDDDDGKSFCQVSIRYDGKDDDDSDKIIIYDDDDDDDDDDDVDYLMIQPNLLSLCR